MALGRILIAAALVVGALTHPPRAGAACDPRWDACQQPRWCATTGQFLPPFSGYCPLGPRNYAPPTFGDEEEE
jgi:hypothetical protein